MRAVGSVTVEGLGAVLFPFWVSWVSLDVVGPAKDPCMLPGTVRPVDCEKYLLHSIFRRSEIHRSTARSPASPQTITQPPTDCRNYRNHKNPKYSVRADTACAHSRRSRFQKISGPAACADAPCVTRSSPEGADFMAGRAHAVDGDTPQDIELMMDAAVAIETKPCVRPLSFSHLKHLKSSARRSSARLRRTERKRFSGSPLRTRPGASSLRSTRTRGRPLASPFRSRHVRYRPLPSPLRFRPFRSRFFPCPF